MCVAVIDVGGFGGYWGYIYRFAHHMICIDMQLTCMIWALIEKTKQPRSGKYQSGLYIPVLANLHVCSTPKHNEKEHEHGLSL